MKPNLEIERKFLVLADRLPKRMPKGVELVQAYLSLKPTVRIRIADDKNATMTVKGEGLMSREEIEFKIRLDKAHQMVNLSPFNVIYKTRHRLKRGQFVWEVDFYHGALDGLITAEVELPSKTSDVPLPTFIGREVTMDPSYKNSALAERGLL